MTIAFLNAEEIILMDFLEKGKKRIIHSYCHQRKKTTIGKEKVLFNQDNTRVHTSTITMSKLHDLKYELVSHPPYNPDLAPSDYYLFQTCKEISKVQQRIS